MQKLFIVALALTGASLALSQADAQVRYSPGYRDAPIDFFSPYDESYGLSPSYQILPGAYGAAPAVRVIERCQYPNGWNVTDFGRDLNGIPNGADHACPAPAYGARVKARY